MKLIPRLMALMLPVLSSQAASVRGDIALPFSLTDTNRTAQTRECGDGVEAVWSCRVGEFYGWEAVFAHVTLTNAGSKPMWGECSLAFYDLDRNLVGTARQTFIARRGLKPRTGKAGVLRIVLPKDRYKDIASYEVVISETATAPLKRKETILLEDP
jgi:hypothetical protein